MLCSIKANTKKMKRSSPGRFILRAAAENDWSARSDPFILSDFARIIGTEHIRALPVCARAVFSLFIASWAFIMSHSEIIGSLPPIRN